MRAAVLEHYGPPDVLVVRDFPAPGPVGHDEVRVAIHASSINPVDWKIRSGGQRAIIRYTLPRVIGMDLSGVVTEVGARVIRFKVGDEVYGSPHQHCPGTYAEETVVPADQLALKPVSLTHVEAATIPLAGLTAWQCLHPAIDPFPTAKVFIMAGSGGVGVHAIQIARAAGATIATTCSARNHALVTGLGADLAIDYHTTAFADVLSDQDMVLDALGGDETAAGISVLRPGGILASISTNLPEHTEQYGPTLGALRAGLGIANLWVSSRLHGKLASPVIRRPLGSDLEHLTAMVDRGELRPVIEAVFELEQIADAHRLGETGRIRGKVAIKIR